MEDAHAPSAWRFDRFTLDLARDALLGPDGAAIPLRPKSLALLKLMVAQAGRVVGRDAIMAAVGADFDGRADQVFRRLHNLRKQAKLPKSGLRGVSPAAVKPEEEELLVSLVVREAGSLGQRDQLPYTARFDAVHAAFNAAAGRSVDPHDLWRLIARLAK